jgi:hypothetical protein
MIILFSWKPPVSFRVNSHLHFLTAQSVINFDERASRALFGSLVHHPKWWREICIGFRVEESGKSGLREYESLVGKIDLALAK